MATVYTRRLGGTNAGAVNQFVPMFTVPTGQTWIVRDFVVTNFSAGPQLLDVTTRITGDFRFPLWWGTLESNTSYHWDGRAELIEGEQLTFRAAAGSDSAGCTVTGYVFDVTTAQPF